MIKNPSYNYLLFIYKIFMTLVKRGAVARKRRKKVFSLSKGAIGSNSYLFRIAQQHTMKALNYSYRGRRERKRYYRQLWVTRLNARVRIYDFNYNLFMYQLRQKNYLLNRKILIRLFFYDPVEFQKMLKRSC
jgi:large subunit ribosomal protein L20